MGKTAATSKASKKNQTTIPARVRRALGISKGDTLLWTISGNEVSIRIENKVKVDWTKTSEMSLLEWTPEEEKEITPSSIIVITP
ncbi:MAG: AbrB/MazE/SpoVT family DNA-binding domain-containing protein [Bdellovibrio sp.]